MKIAPSPQTQLSLLGALLIALIGLCAWPVLHPLTWASAVPLACMAYAAYWVVFELTWNRANVPSLATGWFGRRRMAEILRRESATRGDRPFHIIDLGSGRGELTRHIARALPHATVTGIEMARFPYQQSVFLQKLLRLPNLSYQRRDFWQVDCATADAVVFYLTPKLAQKIGEKLQQELKPGAIIISHTFFLNGGWNPEEIITYRTPFVETIYVYRQN